MLLAPVYNYELFTHSNSHLFHDELEVT